MSILSNANGTSRLAAIASTVLAPRSVMLALCLLTGVGALSGATWAIALFWSLTTLVAGVTVAALAGAYPLPRLADQSHLLTRLSWLGRYGTGALLLCISTFLGGLAGTAIPEGSPQQAFDALSRFVGFVGLYAAQFAIMIFLAWLAIDVCRLGIDRRLVGVARSVTFIAGHQISGACSHPAVTRWLLTLTSPLLVFVVVVTAIVSVLLQLSSLAF